MSPSFGRPEDEMTWLRFHRSTSAARYPNRAAKTRAAVSGILDIEAHIEFCRITEHVVLSFCGFHRPDAAVLAAAVGW